MAAVEIHVFHCGQGDTLLLHLDGRKWVLIDCNLGADGSVQRFLRLLDGMGVTRLDFVLLSHPDHDHYAGMSKVLKHFTEESRSIGTFCDGGFHSSLADKDSALGELYVYMLDLRRDGFLRYQSLSAGEDARRRNPEWPRTLCVLGPENTDVAIARLQAWRNDRSERPNEYSLVVGLESGRSPKHFCGLLTGDAGGDTLRDALSQLPTNSSFRLGFDFVKISHHGSWRSHAHSPLTEACREMGQSVAVVSSRHSSGQMPRQEVLRDYLEGGWRVYDTSRRGAPNAMGELTDTIGKRQNVGGRYDIKLNWTPGGGLLVGPDAARVKDKHLQHYPPG